MIYVKGISHFLPLILLLTNLVIIRCQAQHDDHTHGESDHEISRDSLEIINKLYNQEWNQWRDSLFGIDIKEGMKIGEIGAGNGDFAAIMAEKVGPKGFIYANDVELSRINKIKDLIAAKDIENMVGILGEEDDPLFPDYDLDMAIMVEVYHHIENPYRFFENLKKYLIKKGRLVIVDPDVNQPGGTLDGCYSDPETTKTLLAELGYTDISVTYKTIFNLDLYILQAKVN